MMYTGWRSSPMGFENSMTMTATMTNSMYPAGPNPGWTVHSHPSVLGRADDKAKSPRQKVGWGHPHGWYLGTGSCKLQPP